MKIGVSIDPRHPNVMRECAREAEAAGVDAVVCGDSQSLYREVYVSLTVLAEHSESPDLGVVATNPVTRHLTVTASSVATLDEVSDGRALLGMATGDSAVKNTELVPASLSTLGDAIRTVRELMDEGEAEWRGGTSVLREVDRRIPVYLVGEGPRTLTLGGRIADGIVYGGWVSPDSLEWAQARVEKGADQTGRVVAPTFWASAACEVADTESAAVDELRHILSAKAHIKSFGDMERIPAELHDQFAALGEEYRSDLHNKYDASHNAELLDEHDLREFLSEQWAVAGSPDRIQERLRELKAQGVDGVFLLLRTADPAATIRRLGEDVLPLE